jgi:hypothetical protein
MKLFKIVTALCILLVLVWVSPAASHTRTQFFKVDIRELPNTGPADRVMGKMVLKSLFPNKAFVVTLKYPGVSVKDRQMPGRRPMKPANIRVAPGATATIQFQAAPLKEGKQIVTLELVVESEKGSSLGTQPVDLYFIVKNKRYTRTTYEKLYVPKKVIEKTPAGAPPVASGKAIKANFGEPVVPHPKNVTAKLGNRVLKPNQLPAPGKVAINKPTSSITDTSKPIGMNHPAAAPGETPFTGEMTGTPQPNSTHRGFATLRWADILSPVAAAEAADSYTVSGQFSYRGMDNQLHPGWAWLVKLWWHRSDGSWVSLAENYIMPDGRWSLTFSRNDYSGQHLLVLYRAGSYYVMPQDKDGNEYWWRTSDFNNIPANFDTGHWYADTSSPGILAGLGDVYNSAHLFWNAFYTNNLNPERASAIKLYFPNISHDCGGGSGIWSCANPNGNIWLVPAHTDNCTIQHELSHQLQNEYWKNKRPEGAGGSHAIDTCYNKGLALEEGFAYAVPHWVINSENSDNPTGCGFPSLESPDKTKICNGDTNETWVAATFWDMLDHHADNKDYAYFVNPVDVFSFYLRAGLNQGIKDFRQDLLNGLHPDYHTCMDDIFKNNTITVP